MEGGEGGGDRVVHMFMQGWYRSRHECDLPAQGGDTASEGGDTAWVGVAYHEQAKGQ